MEKISKENARNLTSVFTPTKMLYTTSFRQLNYLMSLFDDYIKKFNILKNDKGKLEEETVRFFQTLQFVET